MAALGYKKAYMINCFNCGNTVRYYAENVHHQPWLNKVVQGHGFTGHTGEVRCQNCGTWLPHYESNEIRM
ncbi:MAG: hypothetical protein IJ619_03665 [Eubacterium sp.]|nr:hypothetical protein [Eubacterium sp.]MCR5292620.1 hypothetical protein [Eubacterium sp.]